MQQSIIRFFKRVLQQSIEIPSSISSEHNVYIDKELKVLVFDLKGLYQLTNKEKSFSYVQFKKALYASTINEALEKLGAKVEIHSSTGKIESNLYKLTSLKKDATN